MANIKATDKNENVVLTKEVEKEKKIIGYEITVNPQAHYNQNIPFFAHDGSTGSTIEVRRGEKVIATPMHIAILDDLILFHPKTGRELTEYKYDIHRVIYED